MPNAPDPNFGVELVCGTCHFVYWSYAPSKEEMEDPECSGCVIDAAFRPLEDAVKRFRKAVTP